MKKLFEYTGILTLIALSFIYTEKAVELVNKNDPIMVSINDYAINNDKGCVEGSITSDGVILGLNGLIVDKEESYSNMKGWGYNEELMEYELDKCLINAGAYIDEYIVKGNVSKKSINIIVNINDGSNLDDINNIFSKNNINISYGVTGEFLNDNMNLINKYNGDNFIYTGNNEDDLKLYLDIMNSIDKKIFKTCLEIGDTFILGYCSENRINTIRAKNYFTKDYLLNTKKSLDNGEILIFKESSQLVNELNSIINYIKAKGFNIVNTKELFGL